MTPQSTASKEAFDRVQAEKARLEEDGQKLQAFMQTEAYSKGMAPMPHMQVLLMEQLCAMRTYHQILSIRLETWDQHTEGLVFSMEKEPMRLEFRFGPPLLAAVRHLTGMVRMAQGLSANAEDPLTRACDNVDQELAKLHSIQLQ